MRSYSFYSSPRQHAVIAFILAIVFGVVPGRAAWAGTTQYDYDTLGRLVKVISSSGAVTTYTYDNAGNRTASQTSGGSASSAYGNKVIVLPLLGGFVLPLPSGPFGN